MSAILDRVREHPVTATGLMAFRKAYAWVTENLWPVYSTGMVISVVCMLAASQEKQILADHLYGKNKNFTENTTEIVDNAAKQLDEEIGVAIKRDVLSMPRAQFEREYAAGARL